MYNTKNGPQGAEWRGFSSPIVRVSLVNVTFLSDSVVLLHFPVFFAVLRQNYLTKMPDPVCVYQSCNVRFNSSGDAAVFYRS